ncbi:hypothetical protein OUZ56_012178 [Daphnia magna]|uniref:Uncharacterized protein n=1 Tax=Daphnia magna TaxID=35525 RepID=A0ABQ9Z2G3_9CRUS|nr:hypothetical protein OUZ56_012178 [Daphnia magna]
MHVKLEVTPSYYQHSADKEVQVKMEGFNIVYQGKELVIAVKNNNEEEIVNESDSETSSESEKSQKKKKKTFWTTGL